MTTWRDAGQQAGIATLTMNPAVDVSCETAQVVADRKLRCGPPLREPGGGGVNVTRAAARLGAESEAVHPSGGATGALLDDLLAAEGIVHDAVPIRGWTRENLTVAETSTGRQFRFGMPGPELDADEAEDCLRAALGAAPPGGYLVASGSLPPGAGEDFYGRLAEALPAEVRLVLDTSGPALRRVVDAGVFLLKPNLNELAELRGRPLDSEEEQVEAATGLVAAGAAETVVVTLGAGGALMASRDGTVERFRSPAVPIRSRVGAGDSTVAGIVTALSYGADLADAVAYGVASGAAAVMTPGTELCRREDADALVGRVRV